MTSDISRSQTMYKSQHMPMTQLSPYCAPNTINPNNSFNHIFTKFMNGSLNNLNINTDKTTTLQQTQLNMAQLSNQTLLTTKHTKIFGFSLDLKLSTLLQHINVTIIKTKECLTFLKHSFFSK